MKKTSMIISMLLIAFTAGLAQTPATDPGITVYRYYKVAPNHRAEFIKRETTYWAEVANKALAKGNITFWAMLEKVGGYDMENKSNFLFINTYKNIDAMGEIWGGAAAAFPNVPMEKMETGSISTVTSMFFLHTEGWQQAADAKAENDFNFIRLIYHNSSNASSVIDLEKKHWAPFIKSIMDKKQTSQRAWGNAILISPMGENIRFNSVSYDLYPTLKDALMPYWDPKIEVPQGLEEINKLEINRRGQAVYRIVKVVSAN